MKKNSAEKKEGVMGIRDKAVFSKHIRARGQLVKGELGSSIFKL
jgi:hypothetical protein